MAPSTSIASIETSSSAAVDEQPATIVGAATLSSASKMFSLLGVQLVPTVVLGAIGAVVAAVVGSAVAGVAPVLMKAVSSAQHIVGASIVGAVLAGFVAVVAVVAAMYIALRLAGLFAAATTIVVDEYMRTTGTDGTFAALGAGWSASGRVASALLMVTIAMCAPVALAGALAALVKSKVVIGVVLVVVFAFLVVVGVRVSLVVPAVVLGDRSAIGALKESWALTEGRVVPTLLTLLLGGAVAMVVGGLGTLLAWIPVVGAVVGFVASTFAGGVGAGTAAGIWRARVDG